MAFIDDLKASIIERENNGEGKRKNHYSASEHDDCSESRPKPDVGSSLPAPA